MAAILPQVSDPQDADTQVLAAPEEGNKKSLLSPAAIGFLVSLFAIFIFGPFFCMWLARRRVVNHRTLVAACTGPRTHQERKDDGRKKLAGVTDVVGGSGDGASGCSSATREKGCVDSMSIQDRECAICLSALYAPSPPERAKLGSEGSALEKTSATPALMLPEQEQILRLKACHHEFHAECLLSWFLVRKYSCPICRASYYDDGERGADREREVEGAGSRAWQDGAIPQREPV